MLLLAGFRTKRVAFKLLHKFVAITPMMDLINLILHVVLDILKGKLFEI